MKSAGRPLAETLPLFTLGPLLITLLVALVVDFSTDTPQLGPFYGAAPASQQTSALCAAAIVALGLGLLVPWSSARLAPLAQLLLALLPAAAALGSFFWTAPLVSEGAATRWDGFVAASLVGFLALAVLSFRGLSPRWLVAYSLLVGTVLRLVHMDSYAFSVGADMLPLVMSAVDALLAGRSPYAWYNLPGPLPLTYYPLTLLVYVPAGLWKLDPRFVNIAGELAIAGALAYAGRRRQSDAAPARDPAQAALVVWGAIYLLPSSIFFDRITTAPVAWAAIAWLLVLVAEGNRFSWLALGLAAATTPLTAVCIPFVAVRLWRESGLTGLLRELAKAAGVALALILPFLLWAPQAYLDGTVLWFNDLRQFPGVTWTRYRTWLRYVGFGGLFWEAGRERWLKPLQASALLVLAAIYLLRREPAWRAPAYAAAAFALFMAFNPVHWPYFYQPVIIAGLVAAAVIGRQPSSPEL